jgi:hypothetical protein
LAASPTGGKKAAVLKKVVACRTLKFPGIVCLNTAIELFDQTTHFLVVGIQLGHNDLDAAKLVATRAILSLHPFAA